MANPGIQQVRPQTRREFMDKLYVPTDPEYGNPNITFSEPFKPGQPEHNRAYEVSYSELDTKNFSIGIKDHTEAIQYYFDEVLKLEVYQNNGKVLVPVIYGTPEKWKSMQKDGYYRDNAGQILPPLIMYKKASVVQNRTLGNKLDGNEANNVQLFEKAYTRRNVYDNFHILQNQKPQKEYVVVVTPDYVTITYSCAIWTNFVEQMDKLTEALNFASNSYWGDPSRFQFLAKIETFNDIQTFDQGEDRLVRTDFQLTLNGYLIPDSLNAYLAKLQNRTYNLCKIVFNTEMVS
jgi:hypothetical protein